MSAHPVRESDMFRAVTGEAKALIQVFKSIHASSCPRTYNFHMHTHCSDGKLTPGELMGQAVELGLKGLAITDHHSVEAYHQAQSWLEDWRWHHPASWCSASHSKQALPKLWIGTEITATLLNTDVHILGYAFEPNHGSVKPYLEGAAPKGMAKDAANVINAIQSAGGVAILAHPARYRVSAEKLIPAAVNLGIDGAETYYAYDNPNPWRPTPEQTQRVQTLTQEHQLMSTCGTDTHGKSLRKRI